MGFRGGAGGSQGDEGREPRSTEAKTLQQESQRLVKSLSMEAEVLVNVFVCVLSELRRAVRSSMWTKDTSAHQHEYGPEVVVDPEEDLYKKTCRTCGHELTYEKM